MSDRFDVLATLERFKAGYDEYDDEKSDATFLDHTNTRREDVTAVVFKL